MRQEDLHEGYDNELCVNLVAALWILLCSELIFAASEYLRSCCSCSRFLLRHENWNTWEQELDFLPEVASLHIQ